MKKAKNPKAKKFTLIEEPMNDAQTMEWWLFAGAMLGVVVGLLTERIALSLTMGVVFGLLSGMIHRAFRKK